MIRRTRWFPTSALLLLTLLAGCAGAGGLASGGARSGVAPPRLEVGESFRFNDGRSYRVAAVDAGTITWDTGNGGRLRTPAKLVPPGAQPRVRIDETSRVTAGDGALWPLANGTTALFRTSVERSDGTRSEDIWSCTAAGPEPVRVSLGEFQAWRMNCDVLRGAQRQAEQMVAHYAPAVRFFVRLETREGGGAPRVAELVDLLTIDPPLPSSAGGRRDAAMQVALESLPSGRDAAWRDPASGLAGKLRPVRTFKVRDGRFCREFEEDTASAQRFDRNRRLACRDPAGEWVEIESS